ncbi:hypothetical protein [Rosenbergiella metrosideri]|uniref:hypothetical protein n=1 Tax=Rosenbergiella metrosideri TaxID=2921185 RepID=UPI001F4F7452|nr:hypothetical protein [Rosenbergiella metrosideri]
MSPKNHKTITLRISSDEKVGVTGIVALLENGKGPVVMIRTDMDALPVAKKTGLPYASQAVGKLEDETPTPSPICVIMLCTLSG